MKKRCNFLSLPSYYRDLKKNSESTCSYTISIMVQISECGALFTKFGLLRSYFLGVFIVDFRSLFNARLQSSLRNCQLRFKIRKLGGNFAAKFPKFNFTFRVSILRLRSRNITCIFIVTHVF